MTPPVYNHPAWYYPGYKHPVSVGAHVYYCPYPLYWEDDDFVEATVFGSWFDNDYPVVNVRWLGKHGEKNERHGVKVDRVMVIDVIGKLAELDAE